MNWYYHDGQKSVGPLQESEFQNLIQAGTISSETLVWKEGLPNWQKLKDFQTGSPPPPPPVETPEEEDEVEMEYAGFWMRFLAKFIDMVVLAPVILILLWPEISQYVQEAQSMANPTMLKLSGMANLQLFLIDAAYIIFFHGQFGATVGKLLLGMRVVRSDGSRIGFGIATLRFLGELLSRLLCYFGGYIIAAFDPERRTLHDHLCKTRVIRK